MILKTDNSHIKKISIVLLLLIVLGAFLYAYFYSVPDKKVLPQEPVVKSYDYFDGNEDSPIVVIEYFDLECQWCKQYHIELRSAKEAYKTKGVTFVYRSFPIVTIHKKAQIEALALQCAGLLGGKEAYLLYIDHVYYNTKSNDTFDLNLLPVIAKNIGLNVSDFNMCRSATTTKDLINMQVINGLSHDVRQTPTYLVFYKDQHVTTVTGPKQLTRTIDYLIELE